MKKWFTVILVMIVLCLPINFALAASGNPISDKSLKIESFNDEVEKDKVLKILDPKLTNLTEIGDKLKWKNNPVKNGDFYKVYFIWENLKNYRSDSSFAHLIYNGDPAWETPIYSDNGELVSTVWAAKVNGKWLYSAGHSTSLDIVEFYLNPQNILNILNKNDILNPESIKHLRIKSLYADILYVKDSNTEYKIPLMDDPTRFGLQNFELYKMSEIIDKLSDAYINPICTSVSKKDAGFGDNKPGLAVNNIAIICTIFALSVYFFLFKEKR